MTHANQPTAQAAPAATVKVRAYLRMRAASCTSAAGERGMVLVLRDTAGLFPEGLCAVWLGHEATAFLDQHSADLTPGRCLDLELYHLRPVGPELRARIKTCLFAPLAPSWIKHAEKANHINPTAFNAKPTEPTPS